MKIEWNEDKNKLLKTTRGICFEQVAEEINNHRYVGPEDNPARDGQKRIIVKIGNYPYVVPFVEIESGGWFLKTVYPCRKMKDLL